MSQRMKRKRKMFLTQANDNKHGLPQLENKPHHPITIAVRPDLEPRESTLRGAAYIPPPSLDEHYLTILSRPLKAGYLCQDPLLSGSGDDRQSVANIIGFTSSDASQLLNAALTDLRACQSEIKKQHAYLISLQNQQTMLEKHIEGYQSLLSPIRNFPPEILLKIFAEFCHENYLSVLPLEKCRYASSGIMVAHFSLHQPLKASLRLDETRRVSSEAVWGGEIGRCHRKNAGYSSCAWSPRAACNLSNRWHSFSFDITSSSLPKFIRYFTQIRSRLPALAVLKVAVGLYETPLLLFQEAPSLRSVDIQSVADNDLLVLPWDQLEAVTVRSPIAPFALLRQTPRVTEITLYDPMSKSEEVLGEDDKPIVTTSVRSLYLAIDIVSRDVDYLWSVNMPSLTDLRGAGGAIPTIISFITRSGCTLTTLKWDDIPVSLEPLLLLLQAIPSLQTLEIYQDEDGVIVCPEFFNRLKISTHVLLPNLQYLKVDSDANFPIDTVITAVMSRWNPDTSANPCDNVACLKSFSLCMSEQTIARQELLLNPYYWNISMQQG
ncbi:hypothetical protein C8J56DRAFT_1081675 [Mycena floridula]|nr:hypothetical protein C8J56DRAFT_1081675 [Mycena floridula]